MMRRIFCLLAIILVSARANADDWNDVVTAAKKEGQVTIYSGFPGAPEPKEIVRMFEARFGIPVRILEGRTAEITERARAEVAAGRVLGDISLNGGNTHFAMKRMDLLQGPGALPAQARQTVKADLPEEVAIFLSSYAVGVNTRLVPPSEEPKSWLDLTEPKWKGKILADDPTAPGGASTWFSVTLDRFGEDFHRKLALQELHFSRNIRENPRRIARGEFPIYIPLVLTDIVPLTGLPIKGVVPREGLPYSLFSLAMLRGAPHSNAARLLMNFFLEPDAQLVYARAGFPIVTTLDQPPPIDLRWMVEAPLMGRQNAELRDERLALATDIYKGK
jgi:iron(III) transport system substrate-binding protein